jgi:glycopeptide antibiotics resistance protein
MGNRKKWKLFLTLSVTKIFYGIAVLCYSSFFIYVLFFARRRRGLTSSYITIIPLKSTIVNFLSIHGNEHHELFNYYSNLIGNILLFLPLPIFLACVTGVKSYKKVFFISFILSLSVELLLFTLRRGVDDIEDILLILFGSNVWFFAFGFFHLN